MPPTLTGLPCHIIRDIADTLPSDAPLPSRLVHICCLATWRRRRLGCDPRHCVVFEDSPAGIQGAHAAGCYAVALPDARMSGNSERFVELEPRWLLEQGIGSFDPAWIVKKDVTRRGGPEAWWEQLVLALICGGSRKKSVK